MELLVYKKFTATNTNTFKSIKNHWKELDEINGASEAKVAKMAGTAVIRLTTASTRLSIIKNTHSRVKESCNPWLISIVSSCICDFYNRASFDFFRAEDSKLYTHDWLNIGIRPNNSWGHRSIL
jgi:hypothetical protein